MSLALRERIGTWGDDQPACYITSTGDSFPNYNGNLIRVMGPDGIVHDSFTAHQFREHLTYQETEYSYAGQTSYQGEVMRANSLARINMTRCMGTPRADDYLARFQEAFGHPAHAILLFDLAGGLSWCMRWNGPWKSWRSRSIRPRLPWLTRPAMEKVTAWSKRRAAP